MSTQANSNRFSSNSRTARTGNSSASAAAPALKKDKKPTTHYMVTGGKGEDRQFVNGLYLTATEGQDGLMVSIPEDVTLSAGIYFINRKKDK